MRKTIAALTVLGLIAGFGTAASARVVGTDTGSSISAGSDGGQSVVEKKKKKKARAGAGSGSGSGR